MLQQDIVPASPSLQKLEVSALMQHILYIQENILSLAVIHQ